MTGETGAAADRYGPFWAMFTAPVEGGRSYLPLLNLGFDPLPSLLHCRDCADACGDRLGEFIENLLESSWRTQLVGAVAMLATDNRSGTIEALWRSLDRPSWVSPQLAATVYRLDERFGAEARMRLQSYCPMRDDEPRASGLAGHVLHGPPNEGSAASAKTFAALASLVGRSEDGPPPWLEQLLSTDRAKDLMRLDVDSGGEIAMDWNDTIGTVLTMAGFQSARIAQ